MSQREFVPTGTLILKQGMMGNYAYVIESGMIEISMRDKEGDEIVLAELGPGSFIGEMAAIFGSPRCASAHARQDSVLIPISSHEIHESARSGGSLYNYLMHLVVERMKDTQEKLQRKQQEKMLRH
jgi:CRP-like cAMP-binding protein